MHLVAMLMGMEIAFFGASGPSAGAAVADSLRLPHRDSVRLSDHPWPPRLVAVDDTLVAQKDEAFGRLTLSEQLEFAAFYMMEYEPPNWHWVSMIGKREGSRAIPPLMALIAKEKSDRFVHGLLACGTQLAPLATSGQFEELLRVSRARVRLMHDSIDELSGEDEVENMQFMRDEMSSDAGR